MLGCAADDCIGPNDCKETSYLCAMQLSESFCALFVCYAIVGIFRIL